jgi:AhpD family alkylhydroperoxidase
MMGVLAESPAALDAYQAVQGAFATSSFATAEQHFLALVISVVNGCTYCVPVYSGLSAKTGIDREVIDAVRDGGPINDERLSPLRDFAVAVVEKRGRVGEEERRPAASIRCVFWLGYSAFSASRQRFTPWRWPPLPFSR